MEAMSLKKNILVLVSTDKDLLEVRSQNIVEKSKQSGTLPTIYNYGEVSLKDVLLSSNQGVLFGSMEFVWIRDIANLSESEFEELVEALKVNTYRNLLLTVIETKPKIKRWEKLSKLPNVKLTLYEDVSLKTYERLLLSIAKNEGFLISLKAIHTLIDRCGGNIHHAYKELEKLMLYKADEEKISENDVLEFVKSSGEVKTFDFINSVLSKSFGIALVQFLDIVAGGEKPEAIFYLLLQQLSNFVTVAVDYKAGFSIETIEKETGLKSWQISKKYIPMSAKWKFEELVKAYWYLLKLDSKIKKGEIRDYSLAIKLFLLEMLSAQQASVQV